MRDQEIKAESFLYQLRGISMFLYSCLERWFGRMHFWLTMAVPFRMEPLSVWESCSKSVRISSVLQKLWFALPSLVAESSDLLIDIYFSPGKEKDNMYSTKKGALLVIIPEMASSHSCNEVVIYATNLLQSERYFFSLHAVFFFFFIF